MLFKGIILEHYIGVRKIIVNISKWDPTWYIYKFNLETHLTKLWFNKTSLKCERIFHPLWVLIQNTHFKSPHVHLLWYGGGHIEFSTAQLFSRHDLKVPWVHTGGIVCFGVLQPVIPRFEQYLPSYSIFTAEQQCFLYNLATSIHDGKAHLLNTMGWKLQISS